MNKAMMIVASAAVAAAATWVPAAEAKGGHRGGGSSMKFSGGGSMKMSSGPRHHHHFRVFRRDTIIAPSYKAQEVAVKRIKPAIPPTASIVRYADGNGRVYDLVSKVWCDGNKHCWTGKLAWTFKNGTWFYGASRWHEAGGTWRTDAAEAPTVVDCETIPAFASLKPTTEQQVARRETDSEGGRSKDTSVAAAPVKTVDTPPAGAVAAKPTDCKKYFPSVGGMLPVPCEG